MKKFALATTLVATLMASPAPVFARTGTIDDFLMTIGINTHIDFGLWSSYGYEDLNGTVRDIGYLGVRLVRDCPADPGDVAKWQRVTQVTGAKFLAFIGEDGEARFAPELALMQQMAGLGILWGIEGPNEPDTGYSIQMGETISGAVSFQYQMFNMARKLGLPAVPISLGSGWTAANNWHGNYDKTGDMSGAADYGNAHTYPQNVAPEATIKMLNDDARMATPNRPVLITEFGYDTRSTSQSDAAIWTLDAIMDAWNLGDAGIYFYALYNDGSGDWGLMDRSGQPKPMGLAVHNLIAILSGASRGVYGGNVAVNGLGSAKATVLQGRQGSTVVALWDEGGASNSVSVTASSGTTLTAYDPVRSITPTSRGTGSITVGLGRNPILVIASGGSSAPVIVDGGPAPQQPLPVSSPVPAAPPVDDGFTDAKLQLWLNQLPDATLQKRLLDDLRSLGISPGQ